MYSFYTFVFLVYWRVLLTCCSWQETAEDRRNKMDRQTSTTTLEQALLKEHQVSSKPQVWKTERGGSGSGVRRHGVLHRFCTEKPKPRIWGNLS